MSIILSARHFPCLTQRTIRVRHLAKVLIVPIEAAVSGYTIALLDAFKLTIVLGGGWKWPYRNGVKIPAKQSLFRHGRDAATS